MKTELTTTEKHDPTTIKFVNGLTVQINQAGDMVVLTLRETIELRNFLNQLELGDKSLVGELVEACRTVVSGYEDDGMENMGARDEVFYRYCKAALNKAKGDK